jgi:RNA polymerase subunit RPABC4/transcription elongation factor Spt4
MKIAGIKICERCKRHETTDIVCPQCKKELLGNYEISHDWQTALEIEKAQTVASRFKFESNDDYLFLI